MKNIDRTTFVAVSDALDFFVGKTAMTLIEETGAPAPHVRRLLRDLQERGSVERKGNLFRIHNPGAPWRRAQKGATA